MIHDVCVIGGGPAALAAALALLASGRDVVVVRLAQAAPAFGEHLSPGALPVLRRLGAAELLDQPEHRHCPGITSRWGTSIPIRRSALCTPGGLGHVIDRAQFDAGLAARLPPQTIVTLDKPSAVCWEVDHWRLYPTALRARFLVDATGRRAAVARPLGARIIRYGRRAAVHVMFECGAELPQGSDLGLASGVHGWAYSVRLADGRVAAAAICESALVPKGVADRADWMLHHLHGLGLLSPGTRLLSASVVPCGMQRLHPCAGPHWIAIGDASFATDPLTGDGLRHALHSGAAAPLVLENGTASYEAVEDRAFTKILESLRVEYQRERRFTDAPFWRLSNGASALLSSQS